MGLISGILRFMIGVASGAAAGMIVARLLTPRTADEYRAAVQERIDDVRQAGEQADQTTRAALEQAYATSIARYQPSSTPGE
jgi:gas vesicle protein